MSRSTHLLLTDFERVEEWCRGVRILFGQPPYLVGSALSRPDYRDIDLRLILPDKKFDREWRNPVKVRLMNRAISAWGQRETGLPIDFQIQRQSAANARWPNEVRNPMGVGVRDWSVIVPEATGHRMTGAEQEGPMDSPRFTATLNRVRELAAPSSGTHSCWAVGRLARIRKLLDSGDSPRTPLDVERLAEAR